MHLQKWGNSLGLRVPSHIIKELHLTETDSLEMILDAEKESLIVRKKKNVGPKKYDLKILLSQITPEQLIEEDWQEDSPRGHEVW